MLEVQVRVEGGEALLAEMRALGIRVSSALRSAMRAGARAIQERAEELAPRRKSRRKATRVRASVKQGVVTIRLMPNKRRWYLRLVETGTSAHIIRPRRAKRLVFAGRSGRLVAVAQVQHPGARAKPWLRPAFDQRRDAAVRAIADGLRAYIERKRQEVSNA